MDQAEGHARLYIVYWQTGREIDRLHKYLSDCIQNEKKIDNKSSFHL